MRFVQSKNRYRRRGHRAARGKAHRRGLVSILAILFLAIFAALGVAFVSTTSLNVAQASNARQANDARLAAESGLSFMSYNLPQCGVSGALRGQALLNSTATKLAATLNGTANLAGATVSYNNTTITVPSINLGGGKSFSAQITLPAADTLQVQVIGQASPGTGSGTTMQRSIKMNFHPTWDQALGFGMCSKGPVQMGMNNTFVGLTNASDGSIYSAASGIAVACGSGHISGSVSVSDPNATVSLASVQVDGSINYHAPQVTMPVIDRTGYKALATNTMNMSSPPSGTYNNIRIPANTNPTFGNNVTLQGMIYIEAPNVVTFGNSVTVTGLIVADDPPVGSPDSANAIKFNNSSNNAVAFNDVTQLPDNFPNKAALQIYKDAEILAPGFSMTFKNNFGSVGGMMALKSLTLQNNETSTVYGSLLIYGPAGVDFKNNDGVTIQLGQSSPPPGFAGYGKPPLVADPGTYVEQ